MNDTVRQIRKPYKSSLASTTSTFLDSIKRPLPRTLLTVIGLTLLFIALGEVSATAANSKLDPSVGVDLLRESKIRMFETSQWWDTLWDDILSSTPTSTINNQAIYAVLLPFLLVAGLVLMARAGASFLGGETHRIVLQQMIPIVLLLVFTLNYGWGAKAISWSFREITNKGGDLLLDAKWGELVVRDALQDQIHSSSMTVAFDRQAQKCAQLSAPTIKVSSSSGQDDTTTPQESRVQKSVTCLQVLAGHIEAEEAKIKAECPNCKTAQDVIDNKKQDVLSQIARLNAALFKALTPLDEAVEGFQVIQEQSARAVSIKIPLQIQYWFVSGQELALMLSAILAPIMIIYSSLPVSGHQWAGLMYLKALVVIALIRFAYIFVIGFGAVFLSDNPVADQAEAFAIFLGYVAPVVATAAVTVGAIAASGAYTGSVIASVGAAVSVVSSAGLAIGSAASSRALRSR